MKRFLAVFILIFLSFTHFSFSKDKPTEAWIDKNGKEVEVIKIRMESGKIIEVRPKLTKEQIPKLDNGLSERTTKTLYVVVGTLLVGMIVGIVGLRAMKKRGP
ncbi:MAG: hypothetical protein ABGX27_04630 [Desulfurobacteriaceae bacterium]